MFSGSFSIGRLTGIVLVLFSAGTALAHGDKVIPQVADGVGADGTLFRTKFDITNLGPDPATRITRVKLAFFQQDGAPWIVGTNLGTMAEVTLELGAWQTARIETLGTGKLTAGYAVVRNLENTTMFPEDYNVSLTCYYEVLKGGGVIDTVSVPLGQPTVAWLFPAEAEVSRNLVTGFAIVNLARRTNQVSLRLLRAGTPTSGNAVDAGTSTLSLSPGEQRARFLNDASLFPGVTSFRGAVVGTSEEPVAILALVQSPAQTGVQYATLVPAYQDSLRTNTTMYLAQGLPLDADIPVSDYFGNQDDSAPWDVLYETVSTTSRRLAPKSGAGFAVIGQRTAAQFDGDLNITYLQSLTYTSSNIDLSDGSSNLQSGFTFGIRTGLGRYVKIRIREVVPRGTERDLALEINVYR